MHCFNIFPADKAIGAGELRGRRLTAQFTSVLHWTLWAQMFGKSKNLFQNTCILAHGV